MGGKNSSFKVDHAYDEDMKEARKSPKGDGSSKSSISSSSDGEKEEYEPIKMPEDYKDYLLLMETPEETKARKRSHWVHHTTMVIMTTGYSIILSGTWPYLVELAGGEDNISKEALGWVIAANPFGQMIASPIVGYIGNRVGRTREVCYFTVSCSIAANALYGLLPFCTDLWENSFYHLMLLSRFVVGLSSANVSLSRSYIAQATTEKERTKGISMVSAAQALGLVIGPAIQAVLAIIIDDDMWKYASVGWVMVILGAINLVILTPCIFTEYNIAVKERALMAKMNPGGKEIELPKPDYLPLVGILFAFFMVQFVYVLMETLMEPFMEDNYGWCSDVAVIFVGMAFSVAGAICIFMFFMVPKLAKRFDERKLMIFGCFIPLIIGTFLFIPYGPDELVWCSGESSSTWMTSTTGTGTFYSDDMFSTESSSLAAFIDQFQHHDPFNDGMHPMLVKRVRETIPEDESFTEYISRVYNNNLDEACPDENCHGCPAEQEWCDGYPQLSIAQFLCGYLLIFTGFPFGISMANSIYSKILGPRPQGTWMGILTAAGSLARILGPVFVSYIYTNVGTGITFAFITFFMILGMIDVIVLYPRLVPIDIPKFGDEEDVELGTASRHDSIESIELKEKPEIEPEPEPEKLSE